MELRSLTRLPHAPYDLVPGACAATGSTPLTLLLQLLLHACCLLPLLRLPCFETLQLSLHHTTHPLRGARAACFAPPALDVCMPRAAAAPRGRQHAPALPAARESERAGRSGGVDPSAPGFKCLSATANAQTNPRQRRFGPRQPPRRAQPAHRPCRSTSRVPRGFRRRRAREERVVRSATRGPTTPCSCRRCEAQPTRLCLRPRPRLGPVVSGRGEQGVRVA